MSRIPLTKAGADRLKNELMSLKIGARKEVIREIAEARAHGDLRENAEYHAAKEKQGFIEGRIAELEDLMAKAQIVDVSTIQANGNGKVVFGATVELVNVETDDEVKYQIVGDKEADIKANLISINSPIARALIGRQEGDLATVMAPGGEIEYEVLGVEYV